MKLATGNKTCCQPDKICYNPPIKTGERNETGMALLSL